MQHTRESILDAAVELFEPAWYDEVTLADIARRAGVSQQTVVNHFGTKMELYLTGIRERFAPGIQAIRDRAVPGDVGSIVEAAVQDYEATGDGTLRTIALAGRVEELAGVVQGGRRAHREWVEEMFTPQLGRRRSKFRERRVTLLAAVLDVTMWQQLRRDQGLGQEETREHLTMLVEGVLTR
jgi:AcrR family transcriptional regulator